jgi:hypothetical protein
MIPPVGPGRRERERSGQQFTSRGYPPPPNRRWVLVLDVLTPKAPRAGGFPKAPAPAPLVCIRLPTLFSARSQHTRRPDRVWWSASH